MPRLSSRTRRRLLVALVVLLALWLTLWIGAAALAPSAARRLTPRLVKAMERQGIGMTGVSFSDTRVSPFLNRLTLMGVRTRFDLNPRDDVRLQSQAYINEVEVRLRNPLTLRGGVRASGLDIRLDSTDLPPSMPFDRFTNGEAAIADLPLTRPREAAQEIREGLKELFIENELVGNAQFEGDVRLKVEDVEVTAHLYTERRGDRFRLRFRDTDIQTLADEMELTLAPEQVDIVSLYPLRVPAIITITDTARDRSRQYERKDPWLRDAHRHVTWSFLLTRRFGPEFAKTVTDAQEAKPGNTPDERAMDFHNNAIGRRLFADGEMLGALPQRVREDPEIIRHPDEVGSFGEDRLLR